MKSISLYVVGPQYGVGVERSSLTNQEEGYDQKKFKVITKGT